MKRLHYLFLILMMALILTPQAINAQKKKNRKALNDTLLLSNVEGKGLAFEIRALPGLGHNHPTFVIWLEKEDGSYIETLFATQYIGKSIFRYGSKVRNQWMASEKQYKAAVPYWGHKRGILNEYGNYLPSVSSPLPDAITGPTPSAGFTLKTQSLFPLSGTIKLLMEINQPWDWNAFWNNNLYPGDPDYRSSAQPAVVYEAMIDADNPPSLPIPLRPIGRSHPSGSSGELFNDLETLTTALQIFKEITVKVMPQPSSNDH